MSKIFLLFAPSDTTLAQQLSSDLTAHGIQHTTGDIPFEEIFQEISNTSHLLTIVSANTYKNEQVLEILEEIAQFQVKPKMIVLRVGVVKEFPKQLKGVLPLDFSDMKNYAVAFEALVDDLTPPSRLHALIPDAVIDALESKNPQDRRRGIEMLAKLAEDGSPEVRNYVEQRLGEMIFREQDPTLKPIVRVTLQRMNPPNEPEQFPTPPPPVEPIAATVEDFIVTHQSKSVPNQPITEPMSDVPTTPLTKKKTAPTPALPAPELSPTTPLWKTSVWQTLGVIGIGLALCTGLISENILSGLPIALVWAILLWFNVFIRDEGRFVWEMPSAMIGNSIMGTIVGFIGSGLALIIGGGSFILLAGLIVISALYGGLIGWLSTVEIKVKSKNAS